ncbi:MAG: molybdopterin-guanine dinucleotide biosynthesis protein B [Clostridiales Family XIII bacterium]|nr:molybdopterin-guanine dinucleotide biosynthesis protein B [Clostridiales Family XIII bacterium]
MPKMPPVIAVSGFKNSGKTTLIEHVLPLLADRGLNVAVIKHDGHRFEADVPGADTRRFLQAGATGAAIFDSEKYMLVKKEAVSENNLLFAFSDADLILMEGFKSSPWPKIEMLSVDLGFACDPGALIAFALPDGAVAPECEGVPVISRNDYAAFAELIYAYARGNTQDTED